MDQTLELKPGNRRLAVESLSDFVAGSVDAAASFDAPFTHLVFDRVFPDDIYALMLANMPEATDYRPMHGRSKGHDLTDGTHTRVKIDLFPEYIRHLPPQKRAVWDVVGPRAVLPPGERGFHAAARGAAAAPIRSRLRQDRHVSDPDPDSRHSGLSDHAAYRHALEGHHGAALSAARPLHHPYRHDLSRHKLADGSCGPKAKQMSFAPNTGYAFAVGTDTWHSADPVGPEVQTRDSILLTYFVDAGALRFFRNRGKRLGNYVVRAARNWLP